MNLQRRSQGKFMKTRPVKSKPLVFMAIMALIGLVLAAPARSKEPPREPVLRIEPGMHTTRINRIGIDAQNRFLVTGSGDKTVRVWDISRGQLIKILRPPIDEGHEGKIYAVTISPDGETIAAAGWTGYAWEGSHSIYLFSRESGKLARRIAGLPNVVHHLTYSKDGRFLVATLGRSNGIRIYRTSDYTLVAEDKDYGDNSFGADFDRAGRLVTTSWDGYIRLYDKNFNLIAKKKTPGGSEPFSVSFSPDGTKVAAGFNDSTKVDVLSGEDLRHLYFPDTSGVDKGNLLSVSWSLDGRYLYAGKGSWGPFIIRKWTDAGREGYKDLQASNDSILHILPLKDGSIAFGSADPAFGIFDKNDKRTLYKGPDIADYRNNPQGFLISHDGKTVQFGYELWGRSPAWFSIPDRLLELGPIEKGDLSPPLTSAEGLTITDWADTYHPKLNGNPLKLDRDETSRSLAIAPDKESFLLGTEWSLRLFDRNGNEKWNIPVPSLAWAVNISGNGKMAVAALGDGTIRWYRISDGKEILALFPHKDRKRWVIWTARGYYDAAAGAEDLIGWHTNNGRDAAADFFSISQFRSVYYRPDVIAYVLGTLDVDEAVRLADKERRVTPQEVAISKMLPPVVSIVSPQDGSEVKTGEVTVKFLIRSPSGEPVIGIKALVDGRPVKVEKDIKVVEKEREGEITVPIPERDSEIAIIAENRYASSEPAIVKVKWVGEVVEVFMKSKLYVLAVGVSDYDDKSLKEGVTCTAKDAKDFAKAILRQKGGLYRDVVVNEITDENATTGKILDGLDWIEKETTRNDVAMIFLAGHGVNDHNGIYYFLPVNVDTERLKSTGVPYSAIKETVTSMPGKVVLFVDSCHSGNIMGARRGVADVDGMVNDLISAENGAVVFASSTGRQYSREVEGNGAFTKALVEGINGKAAFMGNKITVKSLDYYVSERVKVLTGGRQKPVTALPKTVLEDFAVAVVMR